MLALQAFRSLIPIFRTKWRQSAALGAESPEIVPNLVHGPFTWSSRQTVSDAEVVNNQVQRPKYHQEKASAGCGVGPLESSDFAQAVGVAAVAAS